MQLSWQQSLPDAITLHTATTLLSVQAAETHSLRFFLVSMTPHHHHHQTAYIEQRQQPSLTCRLRRMFWTTTLSNTPFSPTGGSNTNFCGRKSSEWPFLSVKKTIVCLSMERCPCGQHSWQHKCLCTCLPTTELAEN